jgi:hypothetical protein
LARPRVRPLQDRELVTEHQDLSFAFARVIRCDPEQSAEDQVTEGEEHRRMILSRRRLGGMMVSDPPQPRSRRQFVGVALGLLATALLAVG